MNDVFIILQWWFVILVVGTVFLQITTKIFSQFFDKGYIFSKILGIAVLSYIVFLLGFLHILPFSQISIVSVVGILFIFLGIRSIKVKNRKLLLATRFILPTDTPWKLFFFEEVLFLIGLFFWSFIRSYGADINGLEKFMDFGFINSVLRADFFPPKDIWFTPFSINYYYFGHLTTAVLIKLSGIPSNISYNLMLATVFGLCLTASFSIGANLIYQFKISREAGSRFARQNSKVAILGGLLIALLVSLGGNLHTIYTLFGPYENEKPVPFWQLGNPLVDEDGPPIVPKFDTFPNSYWYPNATRFIENTIHEFPIYSWVVADLHGHVVDIPFVLFTIALLLSMFISFNSSADTDQKSKLKSQNYNSKLKSFFKDSFSLYTLRFSLLLAFMLAIMYMTNAWDGIIYLLLTIFVILYRNIDFQPLSSSSEKVQSAKFKVQSYSVKLKIFRFELWFYALRFALYALIIVLGFIILSLPFSINFKPFASGVGILCAPKFLTEINNFGPILFEADHCQRSPWWQPLILYGFFYFFVISFIIFISNKLKKISRADNFVLILIAFSTLLIILPEFIYVKDIYPAHYRANTMFKLVFQAFIMLSIASGYIVIRIISGLQYRAYSIKRKLLVTCYLLLATALITLVFIYPYMAIKAYYGELKTFQGLDGTAYLKNSYPSDYEAIQWINKNIKSQPVILEAQGDSYTDYARVSANTGLPTILGWTVHEWLWRGTYDIPSPRIDEVRKLYEEEEGQVLNELIKKYDIKYVFIGDLERQKYANINEGKWEALGKIVFQDVNTKIYRLN